jgi:hypothetical protein
MAALCFDAMMPQIQFNPIPLICQTHVLLVNCSSYYDFTVFKSACVIRVVVGGVLLVGRTL